VIALSPVFIVFGLFFVAMGTPFIDRLSIVQRTPLARWAYLLGGIGFVLTGIGDLKGLDSPLHRVAFAGAVFLAAATIIIVIDFVKRPKGSGKT
jgi:hypothetical protein